jgi:hypothetical protein
MPHYGQAGARKHAPDPLMNIGLRRRAAGAVAWPSALSRHRDGAPAMRACVACAHASKFNVTPHAKCRFSLVRGSAVGRRKDGSETGEIARTYFSVVVSPP